MLGGKNKTAFQDFIEFARSEGSASSSAELKPAKSSPAENESRVGEKGRSKPKSKSALPEPEQRLFKAFKEELVFVQAALKAEGDQTRHFRFQVVLGLLQVPELRQRLADWLGRPTSLIYEGEQVAMLRQKLKDAVTPKPPGNTQITWYEYQLADFKLEGLDPWVIQALSQWVEKGDFQGFLKEFTATASERSSTFSSWLEQNKQSVSYRLQRESASHLRKLLSQAVKGQTASIDGVCDGYAQSILRKSSGPRGIFTLLGAPGTGKTFLAETFAKALPKVEGEEYQLLKFSMEQFNDERANAALFGSGQFYSDATLGQLTDAVRNVPKSIIIFDEIEKAHPEVVQSLLSVLDQGIAKDETSLIEADFSRAFIFFTTNLGQDVLEKRRESEQVLGSLDAQNVAGILQRSDQNPRGLSPEFLSRAGKGKFLIFEELPATSLIEIYTTAWNAASDDSQVETPAPSCSIELATLHLLTHLPALSARAAASAPEQDVIEYLDRALEEFDAIGASNGADELKASRTEGCRAALEELLEEYDQHSSINILLVDDDARTETLLVEQLAGIHIRTMSRANKAAELLAQAKPDLILVDLHISASNTDGSNAEALQQVIQLRRQFPGMPLLLFSLNPQNTDENRQLFRLARNFEGVAGVLAYRSTEPGRFIQWVHSHVERQRFARLITELRRRQKRLSFSWKGRMAGTEIVMSPDMVRTEKGIAPEDIGGVAGLGQVPEERLADIVGNERAVETIFRAVGWLSKPKEIGKFGISPPRGYLLEGPPGTGKTFLAKAVAGECGLPFFSVNGADFVQKNYGESGRLVRELFAKARQYAPSIIFIDEIDAFAMSRDQEQRPEVSGINALLSEMDGFDSRKHPVLVLAATNYRSRLDPALLRAGRFDEVIVCDLPNKAARLEMIRRGYKKVGLDTTEAAVDSLAMRTQGSSAADIDALIREAIYQAVSQDRNPIEKDIEEACARVVYGSVRTDLKLAKEEKWSTACHEAGHALASHLLMPEKKLDYLSIQPRTDSLGFVSYRDDSENARGAMSMTVSELKALLVVLLAGREAERLLLGAEQMSTGATSDLDRANKLAYHAITECGLDPELGPVTANVAGSVSGRLSSLVTDRLRHWLSEAEEQCSELLRGHREHLELVAEFLNEHESMEGEKFLEIVLRSNNTN